VQEKTCPRLKTCPKGQSDNTSPSKFGKLNRSDWITRRQQKATDSQSFKSVKTHYNNLTRGVIDFNPYSVLEDQVFIAEKGGEKVLCTLWDCEECGINALEYSDLCFCGLDDALDSTVIDEFSAYLYTIDTDSSDGSVLDSESEGESDSMFSDNESEASDSSGDSDTSSDSDFSDSDSDSDGTWCVFDDEDDWQRGHAWLDTYLDPFSYSDDGSSLDLSPSEGEWIRDLTEEGIEPNPGPTFKNLVTVLKAKYLGSRHVDDMLRIGESFIFLVYNLRKCNTKTELAMPILQFLSQVTGKQLVSQERVTESLVYIHNILETYTQAGDESYMATLRNALDEYNAIRNSVAFKKVYKLFLYLLTLSAFKSLGITLTTSGFNRVEQEAMKQKYYVGVDFVHCVLDTLEFIYTRGVQCVKLGRIDPLFHEEVVYKEWAMNVYTLRQQSQHLGNPEPQGFEMHKYLSDVNDCVEKGAIILKSLDKSDKVSVSVVSKLLCEAQCLKANAISRKEAQKSRVAPFAIALHGSSSIAKSTLTRLLISYFGSLHNLPVEDEYIYTRNAADEFWVNFNSVQWCVIMDDIAYLKPDKSPGPDKTLTEIIQVINSTAMVPTQAALEDKGKTPMRAKLVVATTNTKDLNASSYFSCPLAVQRRLPYVISVVPKKEYLLNATMIDGKKLPDINDGEYPDFWEFEIYLVEPHALNQKNGIEYASHKLVHKFTDVNDMLAWFGKTSVSYFAIQNREQRCNEQMKKIKVCKTCYHSEAICNCAISIQDGDEPDVADIQASWSVRKYQELRESIENLGEKLDCRQSIIDYCKDSFVISLIWVYFTSPVFFRWMFGLFLSKMIDRMFLPTSRVGIYYAKMCGRCQQCRLGGLRLEVITSTVAALLAMGALFSLFRNMRREADVVQGASLSREEEIGSAPQKDEKEIPNVWYKEDYKLTDLDITRRTLSMKGVDRDKTRSLVAENCVHLRFVIDEPDFVPKITKGFCLGGQYYLVNNHGVPTGEGLRARIVTNNSIDGVREQYDVQITSVMIRRYPDKDLCIIWFPQVRPRRKMTDLFGSASLKGVHCGIMMQRTRDGDIKTQNIFRARVISRTLPISDQAIDVWEMCCEQPTVDGDCGSIILSEGGVGPIILGIHVALGPGRIYALRVAQDFLDEELSRFPVPMIQSGSVSYSANSAPQELTSLSNKAEVRYFPDGNAMVYGSFNGHRAQSKSRVAPSCISKTLLERGYEMEHGPPVMRGWKPWRHNLGPAIDPGTHIDIDLMDDCARNFANDLIRGFSKIDLLKMIEYDDFTVTNGASGVRFVDKMNRGTSAGFPFNKSKRHFLEQIEPQRDLSDPVEFTEEIKARIRDCGLCYDNATQYHPVYNGALKDEPRSFAKIAEQNTRVFMGGPVEHVFVTRRELLSFTKVMQENKFVSECAAGTIAQSTEWDNIYTYLTQFGEDRVVDGDYSKFDKNMESTVILMVFRVITRVLKEAGASCEHLRRVWCIGYDLAFPMINYHGTLMQTCKGHVSGEAMTVIVNSIANSLYVRYTYALNRSDRSCADFKKEVALLTYGDDFVAGIHPKCDFNFSKLQAGMMKINVKVTPADKNAQTYDYMSIRNINFLKRGFRYEAELGYYVCPLEVSSIRKSLLVNVRSKEVDAYEQCVSTMGSAVREYFWHGNEVFEREVKFLKEIVELHPELKFYVKESTFPTWEELKSEFRSASSVIERFDAAEHRKLW